MGRNFRYTCVCAFAILALISCQDKPAIDLEPSQPTYLTFDFTYTESPQTALVESIAKARKDLSALIWLNDGAKARTLFKSIFDDTVLAYPNRIDLQSMALNDYGVVLTITGHNAEALSIQEKALAMLESEGGGRPHA